MAVVVLVLVNSASPRLTVGLTMLTSTRRVGYFGQLSRNMVVKFHGLI